MATGQLQNVLKHLRKILAPRRESGASDGELLERFFVSHDEEAFELLVWRHHRMVLGVCSRILADCNDVEDAFQATFLVLARKGSSIRKRGSLSSWLFGVARRVALEASRGAKRLQPSGLPPRPSCPEPAEELMRQELRGIFDEELGRLPEKYRAPVVLCYLEGMTYDEAAQRLGCSKGTISTRLTRARELLKSRLAGKGLAITAGSLTAWLCANAASAGAPNSLVVATIRLTTSMAAGQAASSAVISIKVAALAEGVLQTMLLTKLKMATTLLASCALVFVTGWTLWSAARSDQPNGFPVAENKAPMGDNKAPDAPSKPQAEALINLPDPIGGIVRSPDGKPLASARVTIDLFENYGPMIEFERRRRWTTTTDEKGAYRISTKDLGLLPPRWNFEIHALAKDLPETRVLVRADAAAKQRKFDDVKFFAGVAVHGRLLDPEGQPAQGVFLYPACLIRIHESWFPRATAAGDDGRFRLVLPAGPDGKVMAVDLIALSANWAPKRVFIAAGAETNLGDIRLLEGTVVEGRLIDENNRPVADAIIAARGNEAGGIRSFTNQWTLAARTDKDGAFRFPSPMADGIEVFATSRVHAHVGGEIEILKTKRTVMILPKSIELHREAGPPLKLALQAVPSVTIRGTVRWANGKPVSRVWVQGVVFPDGHGVDVSHPAGVLTNAEGKYELKAPKGIGRFSIKVSGRREGGFIYIPHAVGKKPGGRQAIGDMLFERLDESIDGVDWEMRVNEASKAPAPSPASETAKAAVEERPRTEAHSDQLPPGAIARLGSVRFCHETGFIDQFALSPDGRTIAAAAGKSAAFWDLATGRLTQRFTFRWNMRCLAFAPDGKSVAIGGEDCIVHLFDLASGKELHRLIGHRASKDPLFRGVLATFFAPDGRTLLSWGADKKLRFWDTRSGKALRQIDGNDWIVPKLSPNGKLLAVQKLGAEKKLHLVDAATGNAVRQLIHSGEVRGMAFAPDEKTLAVACGPFGQPGRITLWDVDSGKELGTLTGLKDAVFTLAFSPDGKVLASGGYARMIRLLDVAAKKELRQTPPLSDPIYGLTFSRDGKTLISSGPETRLRLWDAATCRERFPADKPSWTVLALAYAPDSKLMALASSNKIWLWSPATGKLSRTLEGHEGTVSSLSFSPDGKSLITGSYDGTIRFWAPGTGKEQRRLSIGKGWVERLALSPDGKTLAVWGEATSRRIHLLNAATGAKLRTIEVPCDQPGVIAISLSLRFSPDGKTLYACNGNHVSILRWDAATGKVLPLIGKHDGGLSDVAVSSDGRSVAVASFGGSLYLWETATGQNRLISKDAGLVDRVAFSPDGRLLAVVNSGNSIHTRGDEVIPQGVETREQVRLIRVADGKVIRRFAGHLGGIHCLRFSPDGRTLTTGGLDSTVLVWDVSSLAASAGKHEQPLTPETLAELWKGLNGTAADAHRCMWDLIAAPGQAVPLLGEKLKPVAAVDAERFARLLKKLESDQFAEREQATQELKRLGEAIEPSLRKALQEKAPLETRRRLQSLLDDLDDAERLRSLRAIEVIERIGDKPARDLLRRLSEGAAEAWLTEEARMSLRRLQQRDK